MTSPLPLFTEPLIDYLARLMAAHPELVIRMPHETDNGMWEIAVKGEPGNLTVYTGGRQLRLDMIERFPDVQPQ